MIKGGGNKQWPLLSQVVEVCKHLCFRLIAGVHEAIFDSPCFAFMA